MEGVAVNREFWRGKRVLLTGHTGFKGGWLALWLQELGAQGTGFSLPPPSGNCLFRLAAVDRKMDSAFGDIRDLASVKDVVANARPEIVLHLAAQAIVRTS